MISITHKGNNSVQKPVVCSSIVISGKEHVDLFTEAGVDTPVEIFKIPANSMIIGTSIGVSLTTTSYNSGVMNANTDITIKNGTNTLFSVDGDDAAFDTKVAEADFTPIYNDKEQIITIEFNSATLLDVDDIIPIAIHYIPMDATTGILTDY